MEAAWSVLHLDVSVGRKSYSGCRRRRSGDDDVDVVCFDAWTAVACLAPTRLPCPVTVQLSTDGSDSTHWFAVTVTGD